ncbi:dipeptide/oligopeptide/nickel ABC transporter ATP-binding protein [Amylibacter sp.]|nr:dipeptide/oligopeptide/nickel ABC transporter ATP-binding protein [Amylibacter sp.]
MSFVQAKDLTREYDLSDPFIVRTIAMRPKRILTAVDNVSFSIEKGTTYALVGESGSGKSTIAKMAVGLLKPTSGSLLVDGKNLNDPFLPKEEKLALRRRIQMVFQSPYASLNPRWKVGDIIAEPIKAFRLINDHASQINRVHELLEQVGLSTSDVNKFPHEFSGGQRQRISIARALSSEPEIIICDEPTSALDVSVQAQVLNLLKSLQKEYSLTYLFITHDLAVVSTMANKIGVLNQGKLVEEQTPENLFSNPKKAYTKNAFKFSSKHQLLNLKFYFLQYSLCKVINISSTSIPFNE